jgi:hypothetical protein
LLAIIYNEFKFIWSSGVGTISELGPSVTHRLPAVDGWVGQEAGISRIANLLTLVRYKLG